MGIVAERKLSMLEMTGSLVGIIKNKRLHNYV